MIVKIHVQCIPKYTFMVRVVNSLELYNALIINELINDSEENLIECAYWFHILDDKGIYLDVEGINKFTIRKLNAPYLEKLYE